jgi:nucleotide-binding universal stress UspA family protein
VSRTAGSAPFVRSIFHPSDFSKASERAFAHALAIALVRKTKLVIMHAGRGEVEDWARFPPVRRTLAKWGVLAADSPRSAVLDKLAVRVAKVSRRGDPVRATVAEIETQRPGLVVLATRGRHGLPAWLKPSVAQAIARQTRAMTLFVPQGCRGLVSDDGTIALRRILLAIDHRPDPREAVARAVRAAEAFGAPPVEIVTLYVGGGPPPTVDRPESGACAWRERRGTGDVVDAILDAAQDADLVVMATAGRQGFLDAMRGSVTERVVRDASCPVLAVPAGRGGRTLGGR